MTAEIVLTIIARDRPGLVEKLAETVTSHSGNWVDSSMARLGGEFAGILRVTLPESSVPALEKALTDLSDNGIEVTLRRDTAATPPDGHHAQLKLTGADHPGIVHEVASTLAHHGISIDELKTEVFPGSMTGEQMFAAQADIILPQNLSTDLLCEALEKLASDLMVDIDLT